MPDTTFNTASLLPYSWYCAMTCSMTTMTRGKIWLPVCFSSVNLYRIQVHPWVKNYVVISLADVHNLIYIRYTYVYCTSEVLNLSWLGFCNEEHEHERKKSRIRQFLWKSCLATLVKLFLTLTWLKNLQIYEVLFCSNYQCQISQQWISCKHRKLTSVKMVTYITRHLAIKIINAPEDLKAYILGEHSITGILNRCHKWQYKKSRPLGWPAVLVSIFISKKDIVAKDTNGTTTTVLSYFELFRLYEDTSAW